MQEFTAQGFYSGGRVSSRLHGGGPISLSRRPGRAAQVLRIGQKPPWSWALIVCGRKKSTKIRCHCEVLPYSVPQFYRIPDQNGAQINHFEALLLGVGGQFGFNC